MKNETLRLALAAAVAAGGFAGCQTAQPVREYSTARVYRTEPVGEYTVEHHARLFSSEPATTKAYTVRSTSYSAVEPVGEYIRIRREPVQPLGIEPIGDYHLRTPSTPIYVRPVPPSPVREVIMVTGSKVYRTYDPQRSAWERPVPFGPNSPTGPSNW